MEIKPHINSPQPQNLVSLLKKELSERTQNNKNYSLRAFASSLGISPAALSGFLNQKRDLGKKSLYKVAQSLNLNLDEIKFYSKEKSPAKAKEAPQKFQDIEMDVFTVISEWYHFAILELFNIQGFKGTVNSVTKFLNITNIEAKFALERLETVNLLERDERGDLRPTGEGFNSFIQKDFTTLALQKLHVQFLKKAIDSLHTVELEKRDNTGLTLCMSQKDIPKVKKKIALFRRELSKMLQDKSKADCVYQIVIDFFPLSKK